MNHPRRLAQLVSGALFAVALAAPGVVCSAAAPAPGRQEEEKEAKPAGVKRVVIVTGEDYGGHKWQQTAPVLKRLLEADRRLQVTVVEDLKFLRSPELGKHDVVVMHFKNYDPKVPGPEGWKNLERFVRAGGGLVLVHFACGAFQEWPDFVKLAGRVWNPKLRGHDPRGKFRVQITAPEHPITRGLKAFETTDEMYTCLDGKTPVEVLATAVSKVDGKTYPMAFVLDCGKGRVFHSPLGHDVAAFQAPAVGELFRRGCAWTARLDP